MIKRLSILLMILASAVVNAQNTTSPQMADTFRSNGKIYVVIGVIAIIFLSIVCFLVYLERKLSRTEKRMQGLGNTQKNRVTDTSQGL